MEPFVEHVVWALIQHAVSIVQCVPVSRIVSAVGPTEDSWPSRALPIYAGALGYIMEAQRRTRAIVNIFGAR
jgi:hypothetical protein